MRTILKLKSKNKEEAMRALKRTYKYLKHCDDEKKIWFKYSKMTKIGNHYI